MKLETRTNLTVDLIYHALAQKGEKSRITHIIHNALAETYEQSIVESARIALNYGKKFPSAKEASHAIAERILESPDIYPLSHADGD